MRLFHSTVRFWRWLFAVLGVFIRTHPVLTPVLIVSRALASIARILAFFIPLKVLLLIATPGVPRYFRFFIEPEYRMEWAVGLTIGAVAAYFIALLLEKLCEYWSGIGSRELLEQSSQLSVIGNQREQARGYFSDFTGQAANLLLAVVFFSVGGFLYPTLFGGLSGLILLLFLISWLALIPVDPMQPRGFGGYVLRNTGSYLGYLEALCFLGGFAFIVSDFLFFEGVNILIAILSFLMLRRLLPALSGLITGAVSLSSQRHRIDPLVFSEHKFKRKEPNANQQLLRHFSVCEREERLLALLSSGFSSEVEKVESRWVDPAQPGWYFFDVHAYSKQGQVLLNAQEQVSGKKRRDFLENEALIMDSLGGGPLRMAPVVQEYRVAELDCRLLDIGKATPVTPQQWNQVHQRAMVESLWRLAPNGGLCEIFELSRHYLHERIGESELARMEVAVDTDEKRRIRDGLQEKFSEIQEVVGKLPIFPHNRGLSPKTVFVGDNGELCVTDWGKWSLEPVGVGVPAASIEQEHADALRQARRGAKKVDHWAMRLAARLFEFEDWLVNRQKYNEALRVGEHLLVDLKKCQEASGAEPSAVGNE